MTEIILFNSVTAIHLMKFENKIVLKNVNTKANFIAARILHSKTLKSLWHAFLLSWTTEYTGSPDIVRVGHGSVYISRKFKYIVRNLGIDLNESALMYLEFNPISRLVLEKNTNISKEEFTTRKSRISTVITWKDSCNIYWSNELHYEFKRIGSFSAGIPYFTSISSN